MVHLKKINGSIDYSQFIMKGLKKCNQSPKRQLVLKDVGEKKIGKSLETANIFPSSKPE